MEQLELINATRELVELEIIDKEQGFDIIDGIINVHLLIEALQKCFDANVEKVEQTIIKEIAKEKPKAKRRGRPPKTIAVKSKKNPNWSGKEDNLLTTNYESKPIKWLLRHFPGRTISGIRTRARDLGLTKTRKSKKKTVKKYNPKFDNAKNNEAYAEKLSKDNGQMQKFKEESKVEKTLERKKCAAFGCEGVPVDGEIFCPTCIGSASK